MMRLLERIPRPVAAFAKPGRFARSSGRNFVRALPQVDRYLEIGTWRGASLFWVLELFSPRYAVAVDAYPDVPLNQYRIRKQAAKEVREGVEPFTPERPVEVGRRVQQLWQEHYPRVAGGLRIGPSHAILPQLIVSEPASFDLIYVDGSHHGADVFVDAALASLLVRPGGVMIFDDWELQQPHHRASLRQSLDTFQRVTVDRFEVLRANNQLVMRRRAADQDETPLMRASLLPPTERPADWGRTRRRRRRAAENP